MDAQEWDELWYFRAEKQRIKKLLHVLSASKSVSLSLTLSVTILAQATKQFVPTEQGNVHWPLLTRQNCN